MTMDDVNGTLISTNLTSLQDDDSFFTFAIQAIQIIMFGVVCFVGLIGNTLVIYVVVRFSRLQTVTNMYLVNLAIADLCFLIGIPFLITTISLHGWIFGHVACKVYMISTSINQFTSSILLCIMSADRYLAVCHPISSQPWRTPVVSRIVSLLAWTFSIVLIIPIILHATEIEIGEKKSCVIDWGGYSNSNFTNEVDFNFATTFTSYTFAFSFAVPLGLIVVFYLLVVKKLNTMGPKRKSEEKKKSHQKVASLVRAVVIVYAVCWLPYWLSQFFTNGSCSKTCVAVHLLCSCMSYANSAINPILYAFMSENFRKSFLRACRCATRNDFTGTVPQRSIFPRMKKNSDRSKQYRDRTLCINGDDNTGALPLVAVSKGDVFSTSPITMSSRTTLMLKSSRDNVSQQEDCF